MTLISITEAESTALLEKSGPLGQYVPLSFGPGGLWLDSEDAGARWAIDTLNAMRTAERELAAELSGLVERAIRDELSHLATHMELEDPGHLFDSTASDAATAVFEAMKAAGFTSVRKA